MRINKFNAIVAIALMALVIATACLPATTGATQTGTVQSVSSLKTLKNLGTPIKVSDMGKHFLDPRINCNNGLKGLSPVTAQGVYITSLTVAPAPPYLPNTLVTFTINLNVPANTLAVLDNFLPFGFLLVPGSVAVTNPPPAFPVIQEDGYLRIGSFNTPSLALTPGPHTITFQAVSPLWPASFTSFDLARLYIYQIVTGIGPFVVAFDQAQVFVSVSGTNVFSTTNDCTPYGQVIIPAANNYYKQQVTIKCANTAK